MLLPFPKTDDDTIGPTTIWIDLFDPTPAEAETVSKRYEIPIPRREDLEEIESSSRLRFDNGVLYLSMPIAVYTDAGEPSPAPIGFILSPKVLVTIRYTEPFAFKAARSRCEEHGVETGSTGAFIALIEEIVDHGADLLEKMAGELATISKQVFRPSANASRTIGQTNKALRALLIRVGNTGEHLSYSRDTILALQRIVGFVNESARDWLKPDVQSRLMTAKDDLTSLADFEVHLSGKVQFLLDAILGFINTDQNDIFKVLTIVSVVGIPPTFIASMYGMNFHNMPEYSWAWGYQWGLGGVVARHAADTAAGMRA
jgi:magnesium transporter